jgi:hypothetical protein
METYDVTWYECEGDRLDIDGPIPHRIKIYFSGSICDFKIQLYKAGLVALVFAEAYFALGNECSEKKEYMRKATSIQINGQAFEWFNYFEIDEITIGDFIADPGFDIEPVLNF